MSSLIFSQSGIFKFYLVYMLCHFLALKYLNFNKLFLHDLGLNFGYVTPYIIYNVHKNLHKFWPSRIMSDNFQSSLNQFGI
jgi:hypothetical protein